MRARLAALLARLGRERRGAGVLELGLALPILMVILLGLIDVASCYSAQMSIQQAAARALERVQVGSSRSSFDFVRTEAANAAGVPVSQVTVETWLECNQVRQAAATQDCATGQPRARYVQVTVGSSYRPYFLYSPLGGRNSAGDVPLAATSSVRYQ